MPMRHRREFLASQEEDVWDFRHVRDQQRESSGSWHRHRIADSHDGFGGRVRLHYEHRLLHGDDHALHNLDEHEGLTHLGCEGGALRARYVHGGSRGARLLGPHEPGRHRLTTLRVGSSWGCDAGVLPGGTPTNFFRVLGHDCLEADVGGCHHHHFQVEPANLLEVFEDLHVDFRWRPSGGADADAGAGGSRAAGSAAAAAPADARGLLGPSPAPARQLRHDLPHVDHELVLNPAMKMEEEVEAACQGGIIPGSQKWWNCDGSVKQGHRRRRGHVTGYGPCVCPKGSWWGNKGEVWACWTDLCDNMVDGVVGYDTSMYSGEEAAARRCESDLTPIPGSSTWSNCPLSGAYECWPYCCCPKGQKHDPVMEVCCSCQDDSGACNEAKITPAALQDNESIAWGLNYDKANNPPVKKRNMTILSGLFVCEDCYAVADRIDVDFKIRLFKLTLHTFLINVSVPVNFSMTFKLLGGDGVNQKWTRQNHVLAKVTPSIISLARLLDLNPFLGLSSFSSGQAYIDTPFPEFYIRTKANVPSVWNFGYSYDRTAQPSHFTILDMPWDSVEHNLYDFIKECGMLLIKDWTINISTHIDAEPSIEIGLDINGLTDVGASLRVPMPIDFEAEFNFTGIASWVAGFLDWVKSPFRSGRRLAPHAQARVHPSEGMFATAGRRYELQTPRTPAKSWRPPLRRLVAAGEQAAEAQALDATVTGVAEPEDERPEDGVPILPCFASLARAAPGADAALCFDLLLAAGAPPGRSVKLVAEIPPGYRWESRTRPAADDQSSLALSGCTVRMSAGQLASLSEMTFKVVHDDLADRLGSNQTERKNFQQGLDSLATESQNLTAEGIDRELAARAAVDLIADLVRMLSPVLQSESVDVRDVLLADPPGSAGDSRSTWTFGSLVAGVQYRPLDGPPEGAAAAEVRSGGPSAPAIAALAEAAAGYGGERPEAEAWGDGGQDGQGRRLFINLSMLYGMDMGMKSNGILIGKTWIFNAMDVMKGLLLGVALASARGADWLWDTVMDWVNEHIPGDSWHVQSVNAMFQGLSIWDPTDIVELLDLDICGLMNSVLLYYELDPRPCWHFWGAGGVLLTLVLYVYYLSLKYCSICALCVSCCKGCLRCFNGILPCFRPCWSKAYNDLPKGAFEDYDSNLEDHPLMARAPELHDMEADGAK